MHAALPTKLGLVQAADCRRQLDPFRMQILGSQLRQLVKLAHERVAKTPVAVTETRRGIPHLKIQIRYALAVIKVAALRTLEKFGRLQVVRRVAPGTIRSFQPEQLLLLIAD